MIADICVIRKIWRKICYGGNVQKTMDIGEWKKSKGKLILIRFTFSLIHWMKVMKHHRQAVSPLQGQTDSQND